MIKSSISKASLKIMTSSSYVALGLVIICKNMLNELYKWEDELMKFHHTGGVE